MYIFLKLHFVVVLRATTYYLADRRYDMLPPVLSSDLCSLLGGVDRSVNVTVVCFALKGILHVPLMIGV